MHKNYIRQNNTWLIYSGTHTISAMFYYFMNDYNEEYDLDGDPKFKAFVDSYPEGTAFTGLNDEAYKGHCLTLGENHIDVVDCKVYCPVPGS